MIKYLLVAILFLCGCEPDNIRACGYSCKASNRAMLRYNQHTGECICVDLCNKMQQNENKEMQKQSPVDL